MSNPRLTTTSDLHAAAARIKGTVARTPLLDVSWTSTRAGQTIWLKCENLQVTGSFKIRGAFNMIARIPEADRRRGVITYSSGNHAQAVAFAARAHETVAAVVMPENAPAVKVAGARRLGAEVVFEGTTSSERRVRAERLAAERGLVMVPPFDHPDIVAGQGTVGLEILNDLPGVERVFVPVGGGGLLSGIAAAIKYARPAVEVVGVEPTGAAKMTASLRAGHPVTLGSVSSVADGLLPVRPGDLTFAHVRQFVDRVVTVDDEAIASAVSWLFRCAKLVVEPSGAAATAAALASPVRPGDGPMVAVVSGGNVSSTMVVDLLGRSDE
jgi:threonine dehydratase